MKNSNQICDLLIMAAGRGNRMRPLTDIVPKAMAPYKGETLISNTLKNFKDSHIKIHVTVGYKGGMLADYLLTNDFANSLINTNNQNNAWWIFNSLMSNLNSPVLVLTCDNITDLDIEFIQSEYIRVGSPACMLVPVVPIQNVEGDFIVEEGFNVVALDRNKPTDKYCSGIQVLNPKKINDLIESCDDFYSVWNQLMSHSELRSSSVYPKSWFSVDNLEQLDFHNHN